MNGLYKNRILGKELLLTTIIVFLFFTIQSDQFLTVRNISNLFRTLSIAGILTLGFTLIMIAGDFDLSFGSLIGLINILGLILLDKGVNLAFVFAIMIIAGVIWQAFNALLTVKVGIHAFVATLATWTICRGIIYWITGGKTFYGSYPQALHFINRASIGFVPVSTFIFGICAIFIYLFVNRTKFGRHLYAIGSNPEAARYVGIDAEKRRIIAYIIFGALAGIAAILLCSKLTSGPASGGESFQMSVIGSAFLGATAFKVGKMNIGGSILAVILMAVITNGLVMINVPYYFQYLIEGSIILAAVTFVSYKTDDEGPDLF